MRARLALLPSVFVIACSSSSGAPAGFDGGSGNDAPDHFDSGSLPETSPSADASDTGTTAQDGPAGNDATDVGTPMSCPGTGATLMVGSCQAGAIKSGDVPVGCAPSVDGTLHLDEWQDAACFTVTGTGAASPDMAVYVKYAGDSVYMATIGVPTCGCAMPFVFDPDGNTGLDGDEYAVSVFDDPFMTNGDRADFVIQGGMFVSGMAPAGIVTMCPGNMPNPIVYEWKLPFTALGITPGSPHTYRMAIVHAMAKWPDTLTLNASGVPDDPSTWGPLSSSTNWQ